MTGKFEKKVRVPLTCRPKDWMIANGMAPRPKPKKAKRA